MFQNIHLTKGWCAGQIPTEPKNVINKETAKNPTLKWGRDINKYFSMEGSDMVNS